MPQHLHEIADSIYLDMDIQDQHRSQQMQAHRRPAKNTARLEPKIGALISPVPQLLQNNLPPTEDEIRRIRETISIARKEEIRLKTFSGSRHSNLNQDAIYRESQNLRKDVQNFIYTHERLLSPLLSLPTELLALIFTHCLPNLETAWSNRRPTWKDQPFHLSQVCQRWRTIAIDTPQLWSVPGFVNVATSGLSLRSEHHNGYEISLRLKDPIGYVGFLQKILNRSKNEGLCLWLFNSPVRGQETFRHYIMDLLAKQAFRITTLTIQSGPTTVNDFCAASDALCSGSCSITFPRLRRLVLDLDVGPFGNAIDGFEHTPALRDVTVRGMHPFRLPLPWAQLRAYSETAKFWAQSGGNLDTVLSLAQGLEKLDVAHLEYDISPRSFDTINSSQRASGPIKLIDVRLDFPKHNHREQSINALLTHFHYPAIQTLRIDSCFYDILTTFLTIANDHYPLFPRPFSNLMKLHYRSKVPNPFHLISFLRLSPNLEELDIELPSNTELLTHISTHHSIHSTSHHTLAPALKRLFIHCNFSQQNNEYTDRALSFLREATKIFGNNFHRNPFPHVCLIFEDGDPSVVSEAEAYLNHYITSFSGHLASPVPLSTWRNELQVEIPNLKSARVIQSGSGFNTSRFSVMRLNTTLANIEQYKLTSQQMRKLYVRIIAIL